MQPAPGRQKAEHATSVGNTSPSLGVRDFESSCCFGCFWQKFTREGYKELFLQLLPECQKPASSFGVPSRPAPRATPSSAGGISNSGGPGSLVGDPGAREATRDGLPFIPISVLQGGCWKISPASSHLLLPFAGGLALCSAFAHQSLSL